MIGESYCCGVKLIMGDICSACGEHSDVERCPNCEKPYDADDHSPISDEEDAMCTSCWADLGDMAYERMKDEGNQ